MMRRKGQAAGIKGSILIVDDEPNALRVLSAILGGDGYAVHESQDCDSAMETLSSAEIDTVIADLKMPGKDGNALFNYVLHNHPQVPFIFLTAYGTIESAVQAVSDGAFYYFVKPPDFLRLKEVVWLAVEKKKKNTKGLLSPAGAHEDENRYRVTGKTDQMLKVTEIIESVRDGACDVLICGEAGTGKELAARAIHYGGRRRHFPFVDINCTAIPGELLESELFGGGKDAFSEACTEGSGRFETAGCGTVFLDGIGELGLPLQDRLLRVLEDREQEGSYGDKKKSAAGFRLIASTSRDLAAEVRRGNFREDLFCRVNRVQIRMPSLKERMDDLPLLATEFLGRFCRREDKKMFITDEVMGIFQRYSWPGNVRQLKNVIERAVLLSRKEGIAASHLPAELLACAKKGHGLSSHLKTLKELEMQAIRKALSQFDGNKSRAARALGISRKSFYKKLIGH